ncbi:MAG: hypothetical protein H0T75_18220 [Rhizobiales bacterium]|nr:hypothetical protein [Hyphomicrobiales bacterium]MDQ3558576.1 hypothetical protein [Pseudomonadota bacterium]
MKDSLMAALYSPAWMNWSSFHGQSRSDVDAAVKQRSENLAAGSGRALTLARTGRYRHVMRDFGRFNG